MEILVLLGALASLVGIGLLAAGVSRLRSGTDGTAYALGTAPSSKRAQELSAPRPASWRATRALGAALLALGGALLWVGW